MPKLTKILAYSLIELAITICLTGMLLIFTVPAYTDYKKKTQVANIINLARPCQLAFQEFLLAKNHYPKNCSSGGTELCSTYTDQLNKACFPQVATTELSSWQGYSDTLVPPRIEFYFASTFYTENSPAQPVMFWLAMDGTSWQTNQTFAWRCRTVTGTGSQIPDKYIPTAFLPCVSGN